MLPWKATKDLFFTEVSMELGLVANGLACDLASILALDGSWRWVLQQMRFS